MMKRMIWLFPIFAIIGGMATNYFFSSSASAFLRTTVQSSYPQLAASQQLIFDLNGLQDGFKTAVSTGDKNGLKQTAEKAAVFRSDSSALAKIPEMAAMAADIQATFASYYSAADESASIMLELKQGNIAVSAPAMQAALQSLSAKLQAAKVQAQSNLESSIRGAESDLSRGSIANMAASIFILLVSLGASRFTISRVLRQLGGEPEYAKTIVHGVADGNLNMPVAIKKDDSASLLFAVKAMQEKFALIIVDIRASVGSMSEAANDIATGNMDLARRTEHQGTSLEETAATLDQLTSTVTNNAENAKEADRLASDASRIASEGGRAVNQVVATMEAINGSARKIVDIIAVIDGIAFQTNILALNAAVEAARAGEQGRGFAVVASEVRNLAQRSAAAAKEIKELISDSVEKVTEGSKQAQSAGDTMHNIVASVKLVNDLIAQIAAASEEQSQGIVQVNKAIADLEAVTQENSGLVEHAANASASLEELAQRVAQSVSVFRLGDKLAAAKPRRVSGALPAILPAKQARKRTAFETL